MLWLISSFIWEPSDREFGKKEYFKNWSGHPILPDSAELGRFGQNLAELGNLAASDGHLNVVKNKAQHTSSIEKYDSEISSC